jgi:hypothetical protein
MIARVASAGEADVTGARNGQRPCNGVPRLFHPKAGAPTMGLMGKIFEKLGMKEPDLGTTADGRRITAREPAAPTSTATRTARYAAPPAAPKVMPMVDVMAQLEKKAAANPQKLNWQTSIVDLLKLLEIDSSLENRKDLAKELGAPAQVMEDSATMNTWLQRAVLGRIAGSGGNVPKNLLD